MWKKSSIGKVTVYLGKRDFIDHCDGNVDPVEGVVSVEKDYLNGRKIFGQVSVHFGNTFLVSRILLWELVLYSQLITTYRYGREEDEVMGVKFSKVIPLAWGQVVPPEQDKVQITKLQQRLMDKLGGNAYPFYFKFPSTAPSSVVIQSGDEADKSKPLGVEYRVRTFVGESIDDPGRKRSSVSLAIKKVSLKLNFVFYCASSVISKVRQE